MNGCSHKEPVVKMVIEVGIKGVDIYEEEISSEEKSNWPYPGSLSFVLDYCFRFFNVRFSDIARHECSHRGCYILSGRGSICSVLLLNSRLGRAYHRSVTGK